MAGKYESRGEVDILVYKERNVREFIPGTSIRAKIPAHMLVAPELVKGIGEEFVIDRIGRTGAQEKHCLSDLYVF